MGARTTGLESRLQALYAPCHPKVSEPGEPNTFILRTMYTHNTISIYVSTLAKRTWLPECLVSLRRRPIQENIGAKTDAWPPSKAGWLLGLRFRVWGVAAFWVESSASACEISGCLGSTCGSVFSSRISNFLSF